MVTCAAEAGLEAEPAAPVRPSWSALTAFSLLDVSGIRGQEVFISSAGRANYLPLARLMRLPLLIFCSDRQGSILRALNQHAATQTHQTSLAAEALCGLWSPLGARREMTPRRRQRGCSSERPGDSWTLFKGLTRCKTRRSLRLRLISGGAACKQDALSRKRICSWFPREPAAGLISFGSSRMLWMLQQPERMSLLQASFTAALWLTCGVGVARSHDTADEALR